MLVRQIRGKIIEIHVRKCRDDHYETKGSVWWLHFNGHGLNMFCSTFHFQENAQCRFKIGVHSLVQVSGSVSLNTNVWQAEVHSDNNGLSSN